MNNKRTYCEVCESSDGLADYGDHVHCYACGYHSFKEKNNIIEDIITDMFNPSSLKILPIKDRNISEQACKFYGIQTEINEHGQEKAHYYPLFSNNLDRPERIGAFIRKLPKTFSITPSGLNFKKIGLFGQHLFPKGCSKYITVTEGALDAVAAYEMLSRFPVVSVISGVGNAVKEFKNNLEYLESFERVYICFDADKPGKEAMIKCAEILSPGKARLVKLNPDIKDACEYKKRNKAEAFVRTWWNASIYTPAGILTGTQVADRIKNKAQKKGIPYPFEGLNRLTYGIRSGEAVIITAPSGVGKTSFMREIEKSILENDKDAKIGTLFLEETPEDSGLGLMSIHASIPFHFPDVEYTQEQYENAENVLKEDRVYFFDSFGSNKIEEIIARVRYYVKGLGCKYIILDHLSIIVSDQTQGDERKALDAIMTRLKTLTIELDMALIAAVHVNRQGQIRGTAGIEQLANIVINLDRDIMDPDPIKRRTVRMLVSKNRTFGRTGPACICRYEEDTGRTVEISDETYIPDDEDVIRIFGEDEAKA